MSPEQPSGIRGQGCSTPIKGGLCGDAGLCIGCWDKANAVDAADAVREYLRSDPERCAPTCRVGCPCDGGMQDGATGAGDAATEIVEIVLNKLRSR